MSSAPGTVRELRFCYTRLCPFATRPVFCRAAPLIIAAPFSGKSSIVGIVSRWSPASPPGITLASLTRTPRFIVFNALQFAGGRPQALRTDGDLP